METIEKIPVYIDFKDGRTVCICKQGKKKCNKHCVPDIVERDKFYDWESTFYQNRYGK
jgi:hypothetical protein